MAKPKRGANPFYFLLVIVGVAFVVTASSFWMRAYREVRPARRSQTESIVESHPLWDFMDEYGNQLLIYELVALGVLTLGAIVTDEFWAARNRQAGARKGTYRDPVSEDPISQNTQESQDSSQKTLPSSTSGR